MATGLEKTGICLFAIIFTLYSITSALREERTNYGNNFESLVESNHHIHFFITIFIYIQLQFICVQFIQLQFLCFVLLFSLHKVQSYFSYSATPMQDLFLLFVFMFDLKILANAVVDFLFRFGNCQKVLLVKFFFLLLSLIHIHSGAGASSFRENFPCLICSNIFPLLYTYILINALNLEDSFRDNHQFIYRQHKRRILLSQRN